tara:strand:- start:5238 stop:5555 length:318 start_codon:yes stop_codon:yes gene_type:complete
MIDFMPNLNHFLTLSAILFTIGLFGALTKRNLIVILMSVEIMLNGINIALVAFANYTIVAISGHVFALFVITVAAAEVAIGLALIIAVFRTRDTIDLRNINLLKW